MPPSTIPPPCLSRVGSHALNTYAIGGLTYYQAADLARILGISLSQALHRTTRQDKLMHFPFGSSQPTWFINHTGLYDLIFKSKTPQSEALRGWVKDQLVAYLQSKQKGGPLPW